jgi:O-antigen/teichoic acid export membrane protein
MARLIDLTQFRVNPVAAGRSWLRELRTNPFFRDAALLSGGSATGQLFTLAVSPLLTRMYGPVDFATLGLFMSFLSVAGVGVTLQFETSIMSAVDSSEASYLALSAAFIGIPTSIAAGLALHFFIRYSMLGFGRLPEFIPIALSLVMCFVGYFAVLRYWSLRKGSFRDVSQAMVVQSGARAIFQTLSGIMGLHSAGLIVGETLGRGVGMGRMFRSAWPELKKHVAEFRWSECKRALLRNWKFPILSFPSSLIDALCMSIALPLLVQEYGPQNGGYYALSWRVLALPSVLITQSVADTFHSRIAVCARETPIRVLAYFKRTSLTLLLAGSVPCLILMLWARPIFTMIFGAQWAAAGTMTALIAPWYLAQFVVNPLSRVVLVLSGQETKLIWDMVCLVTVPSLFYFAREREMGVFQTVGLLSIVSALLYVAYFAVLVFLLLKHHRIALAASALNAAGGGAAG